MKKNYKNLFFIGSFLLSSASFLMSATSPVAQVSLHAFSNENGFTKYGHMFVSVKNMTFDQLNVGIYKLNPGEQVSIGLWGKGGSSSIQHMPRDGVFYNYEYCMFNDPDYYKVDNVYMYRTIFDKSKVSALSSYIVANNKKYNSVTYNCIDFATDAFNILTDSILKFSSLEVATLGIKKAVFSKIESYAHTSITTRMYGYNSYFYYDKNTKVDLNYEL